MVSLQLLNALLNIALWILNGVIGVIAESNYVLASKLQLKLCGKTRATDSSETNIFQWLSRTAGTIFGDTNRLETGQTANWVFSLLIFSLLFLPAEIYIETGIDERRDCSPSDVFQNGLCASPWQGHSDTGIASSALLVQKIAWTDQDWDIVFEGVSPNMIPEEVHVETVAIRVKREEPRSVLASECHVTVSSCTECGTLTVGRDNGAFDTIITNASIAIADINSINEDAIQKRCPFIPSDTTPIPLYRGDVTYDFATGLAFFFWAQPCEEVTSQSSTPNFQLKTKGVETLLNQSEIERVLLGRRRPWTISLSSTRTRLYDINCNSPGLGWKDMTKAVSLYRTVQMEQPGLQRTNVFGNLSRIPHLSSSDVLKSLFALKAEDVASKSCSTHILQYQQCGTFRWSRAWVYFGLCVASGSLWMMLRLYLGNDGRINLPHTSASWRRVAALAKKDREAEVVFYNNLGNQDIFVSLAERLEKTVDD